MTFSREQGLQTPLWLSKTMALLPQKRPVLANGRISSGNFCMASNRETSLQTPSRLEKLRAQVFKLLSVAGLWVHQEVYQWPFGAHSRNVQMKRCETDY